MRTFEVTRGHDESGISGTGAVMEGAVFGDGRVVLRWLSKPYSYVMWDRFEDMWMINIASHPSNETEVHWDFGGVFLQDESAEFIHDFSEELAGRN